MKCDVCKINEATMFIQQVRGDQTQELHLCAACAKERGLVVQNERMEMTFKKFISNYAEKRICTVCGQTLDDVRKHRRVGCPQCYIEFADDISGFFAKNGWEKPYMGSLPLRLEKYRSVLEDRANLQSKLQESVDNEDYEKAAVYRDRLRELDAHHD